MSTNSVIPDPSAVSTSNIDKHDYQIGYALPENNSSSIFSGRMKQIVIWNAELDQNNVTTLYNEGNYIRIMRYKFTFIKSTLFINILYNIYLQYILYNYDDYKSLYNNSSVF